MDKINEYVYREILSISPISGGFDVSQVEKIIKNNAPLAVEDKFSTNAWIVCYTEKDRKYSENYIEMKKGKQRPGLPIIEIYADHLEIAAGYQDGDNFKFRKILESILQLCPFRIFDENGDRFDTDFSKYPQMCLVS